jgi:hypothetical protein
MKKINYKKALLWGSIVLIIHMLIGNLFYMNPVVMDIFQKYEGHPTMKTMEAFGGMSNWIFMNAGFSVLYIVLLIILYVRLYECIPGKDWVKGISYGIIIGLVKALPEAFNQFMVFNYPTELIVVQLAIALLGLIIFGILLSVTFYKFSVIRYSNAKP